MTERTISRRDALAHIGLSTGILFAGGAVVWSFNESAKASRIEQEQGTGALKTGIDNFKSEITEQGTKEAIGRLTQSHNYFAFVGETLWRVDKQEYWRVFSNSLKGSGPDYGHHTPKYWEDLLGLVGKPNMPLGGSLIQLVDRLNQHSAHFGNMGDTKERKERIKQLKVLHGDINQWELNSEEANLRVQYEQLQLERDIGLYYLTVIQLVGNNRNGFATMSSDLIQRWLNNSHEPLVRVLCKIGDSEATLIDFAKQTNPFS